MSKHKLSFASEEEASSSGKRRKFKDTETAEVTEEPTGYKQGDWVVYTHSSGMTIGAEIVGKVKLKGQGEEGEEEKEGKLMWIIKLSQFCDDKLRQILTDGRFECTLAPDDAIKPMHKFKFRVELGVLAGVDGTGDEQPRAQVKVET